MFIQLSNRSRLMRPIHKLTNARYYQILQTNQKYLVMI